MSNATSKHHDEGLTGVPIRFVIVPPGGGEADYSREAILPAVPHEGDVISWRDTDEDPNHGGLCDFVVRRVLWNCEADSTESKTLKLAEPVVVEVEFAISMLSSKSHKQSINSYRRTNGREPIRVDASGF